MEEITGSIKWDANGLVPVVVQDEQDETGRHGRIHERGGPEAHAGNGARALLLALPEDACGSRGRRPATTSKCAISVSTATRTRSCSSSTSRSRHATRGISVASTGHGKTAGRRPAKRCSTRKRSTVIKDRVCEWYATCSYFGLPAHRAGYVGLGPHVHHPLPHPLLRQPRCYNYPCDPGLSRRRGGKEGGDGPGPHRCGRDARHARSPWEAMSLPSRRSSKPLFSSASLIY